MTGHYDVGVVGAGVMGLAHAYHLAKRGFKVIVFERHAQAQGASIRNFGMIWPIGQPAGNLYNLAMRSREHWLEILRASGLWHDRAGSLHLACQEDEAQVLREFADSVAGESRPYSILSPPEIEKRYPAIRTQHVRLGLHSEVEIGIDPRQVIRELPGWLHSTLGITFSFETAVRNFTSPIVSTTRGDFNVRRLVVCTGADFREVAPEAFAQSGLFPCKLQMMRTQPYGNEFRVGTMLAAGLTLKHYKSFANCPSLPALADRLDRDYPEYKRFGIHVLVAQNGNGELILGDSHEYGEAIEPFDKSRIDDLVLAYLDTFLLIPNRTIAGRWHGIYLKHPYDPYVVAKPTPDLLCVSGVGGAGMTLSFGVAEHVLKDWC
jgi:FAD dependent oxidoreductase TIGR03364